MCSVGDLKDVHEFAPRMLRVVPGIRAEGGERHDQGRVGTPAEALDGGADLLVIGRTVTKAEEPMVAAAAVAAAI